MCCSILYLHFLPWKTIPWKVYVLKLRGKLDTTPINEVCASWSMSIDGCTSVTESFFLYLVNLTSSDFMSPMSIHIPSPCLPHVEFQTFLVQYLVLSLTSQLFLCIFFCYTCIVTLPSSLQEMRVSKNRMLPSVDRHCFGTFIALMMEIDFTQIYLL